MKKRIFIVLFVLLFTSGCTCEYNLTIDNNNYQERVQILAENESEISSFNANWKIPTDKEEYNTAGDPQTTPKYESDLYDYKLNYNILTFNYSFNKEKYKKSSAVSKCFDRLNIVDHNGDTIISTSTKAKCFEENPQFNKLTININVDRKVISSNADQNNGKTYTWYIDKNNYHNKPINITLAKKESTPQTNPQETQNQQEKNNEQNKDTYGNNYDLYIFLGIVLILILIGYIMFKKMSQKNNQMDD